MIRKTLAAKEAGVEIQLLIAVKPLFDGFSTKFHNEEPMIHLLYPSCEKLLKTTVGRVLKNRAYTEKKGGALKEVNVDIVDLQLKSDHFKAMQGIIHFVSFILF